MGHEAPFHTEVTQELYDAVHAPWPDQVSQISGDEVLFSPARTEYALGNRLLPIAPYRDFIVDTILNHPVVVIDAKTAGGKSTQIAQGLLETGKVGRIIETQPRILAARELGGRIANEISAAGYDGPKIVGFHTANQRNVTPENEIVIATDGLAIRHMLSDNVIKPGDIVLLDEQHERNANMDVALALCHAKGIHLVIMSATLNVKPLVDYCSRARGGIEVPIIEVPGRMYNIKEEFSDDPLQDVIVREMRRLARTKEDPGSLVFVPGRSEMNSVAGRVARRLPNGMVVVTLNGDQTPKEQAQALKMYPRGKVVLASDVAKTSLTVPGIDAVIDGGYERTGNFSRGITGLPIQVSSSATTEQRKGRAGRVQDGLYFTGTIPGYPVIPRNKKGEQIRPDFDVPQIQRIDVAGLEVRLSLSNITLRSLFMLDAPPQVEMYDADERLQAIGAMVSNEGEMSLEPIGAEIADIPLDTHFARILVEARKYSPAVQLKLMACLAASQQKSICSTEKDKQQWRYLSPHENRSDILIQGDLLIKSLAMSEAQRNQYHFIELRRDKAITTLERLIEDAGMNIEDLSLANQTERREMLKCIIAGGYELFVRLGDTKYRDKRGIAREISDSTVVNHGGRLVLGHPVAIYHMRAKGPHAQSIITHATAVDIADLQEIVPDRLQYSFKGFKISKDGRVVQEDYIYFDGAPTRHVAEVPVSSAPLAREYLIDALISQHSEGQNSTIATALYAEMDRLRDLQNRTTVDLQIDKVRDIITESLQAADDGSLKSVESAAAAVSLDVVRSLVDEETRAKIYAEAPDEILVEIEENTLSVPVEYKNNAAYLTVPVQFITNIPAELIQLGERRVFIRENGSSRYMTYDEAQKYYGRHARNIRRGQIENEIGNTGPVDISGINPESVSKAAALVIVLADSVEIQPRGRRRHK